MKQTFVQLLREPITRESVAKALEKIASRLKLPPIPDQNQNHNGVALLEVSGIAYNGAPDGIITLTFY